jgi:hypothetical protein
MRSATCDLLFAQIECAYHGWQFDGDGSCTKMPSTLLCRNVAVSALPCVEKDGFIWVWPGEGMPPEVSRGAWLVGLHTQTSAAPSLWQLGVAGRGVAACGEARSQRRSCVCCIMRCGSKQWQAVSAACDCRAWQRQHG